jgi:sec-independent protein translocase protein TatC
MELVTARFLVNNLKYAIFLTFVIAAVITPTGDVTVQTLFALPMIGLYVVSIVVAWMVGRAARRAGRAPAAAATSEAEEQRLVGVGPHEQ